MKKIFSIVLAIMASVFVCSTVFAKNVDAVQPFMTAVPANATGTSCDPYYAYPTCISVTNYSSYPIFVKAFDNTLRQLNPNMSQPLVSTVYYNTVWVELYDYTRTLFWANSVNNRWDVPVYNRGGQLTVQPQPQPQSK